MLNFGGSNVSFPVVLGSCKVNLFVSGSEHSTCPPSCGAKSSSLAGCASRLSSLVLGWLGRKQMAFDRNFFFFFGGKWHLLCRHRAIGSMVLVRIFTYIFVCFLSLGFRSTCMVLVLSFVFWWWVMLILNDQTWPAKGLQLVGGFGT